MNQPTDPGAVILYQCGLGCFVSDGDDWKRPAIYDSIRYFRMFWVERESRFRVVNGDRTMSNGHKLELVQLENGDVEVAYWDWQHGNDRVFYLKPNGTATQSVIHVDYDEETPVNLVEVLRQLANELSED